MHHVKKKNNSSSHLFWGPKIAKACGEHCGGWSFTTLIGNPTMLVLGGLLRLGKWSSSLHCPLLAWSVCILGSFLRSFLLEENIQVVKMARTIAACGWKWDWTSWALKSKKHVFSMKNKTESTNPNPEREATWQCNAATLMDVWLNNKCLCKGLEPEPSNWSNQ